MVEFTVGSHSLNKRHVKMAENLFMRLFDNIKGLIKVKMGRNMKSTRHVEQIKIKLTRRGIIKAEMKLNGSNDSRYEFIIIAPDDITNDIMRRLNN